MRVRIKPQKSAATERAKAGGNYFSQDEKDVTFITSGCKLLDLALGGGWAQGRVANIVGDKSTGKTLLCIEISANFARLYDGKRLHPLRDPDTNTVVINRKTGEPKMHCPPKGKIYYREVESAFDKSYAAALGMPIDRIDFGKEQIDTVEDLFEDIGRVLKTLKGPGLYIVDSLDALTDRAEMKRDLDEGSYGANKAKQLSQLFRRLVRKMEKADLTLVVVSQVRDKINAMFGRKTTRSGGKALDFYASQVLYLANLGVEYVTVRSTKRATGVNVRAKLDKNKVGLPFRECDFTILFGYGVDDIRASIEYLKKISALKDLGLPKSTDPKAYAKKCDGLSDAEHRRVMRRVRRAVTARWYDMEDSILPKRKKYA